jgi:hypothetical protein
LLPPTRIEVPEAELRLTPAVAVTVEPLFAAAAAGLQAALDAGPATVSVTAMSEPSAALKRRVPSEALPVKVMLAAASAWVVGLVPVRACRCRRR